MNKKRIFDLFDDSPEMENQVKEQKKSLSVFNHSPYHKLGMFTKLIINHYVFHQKLEKFLKKEEPNYDVQSTKEASEFVIFNRAWNYISQVNPDDVPSKNAILEFDFDLLDQTLESALMYFEGFEEYEKCAHIHKIQKLSQKRKK